MRSVRESARDAKKIPCDNLSRREMHRISKGVLRDGAWGGAPASSKCLRLLIWRAAGKGFIRP